MFYSKYISIMNTINSSTPRLTNFLHTESILSAKSRFISFFFFAINHKSGILAAILIFLHTHMAFKVIKNSDKLYIENFTVSKFIFQNLTSKNCLRKNKFYENISLEWSARLTEVNSFLHRRYLPLASTSSSSSSILLLHRSRPAH